AGLAGDAERSPTHDGTADSRDRKKYVDNSFWTRFPASRRLAGIPAGGAGRAANRRRHEEDQTPESADEAAERKARQEIAEGTLRVGAGPGEPAHRASDQQSRENRNAEKTHGRP